MNPQIVGMVWRICEACCKRFSDRVTHFFTLNEPQCFVGLGFLNGEHAPGVKAPMRDTFEMSHNAMKWKESCTDASCLWKTETDDRICTDLICLLSGNRSAGRH